MRLFIGIPIPQEIRTTLERVLSRLRPTAQLSWSQVYNLHITTKFIGEWPAERLHELNEALQPVAHRAPFELEVSGVGWFPNPHSPRILWAAIQRSEDLQCLATDTEQAMAKLGISPEDRSFTPHLTLARIRKPVPLAPLRQAVAALPNTEFGSFMVSHFDLYLSEPGPAGSIYTSLERFPLEHE